MRKLDRRVFIAGSAALCASPAFASDRAPLAITTPMRAPEWALLQPGCGARLRLKMQRYANQPTLAFPWAR